MFRQRSQFKAAILSAIVWGALGSLQDTLACTDCGCHRQKDASTSSPHMHGDGSAHAGGSLTAFSTNSPGAGTGGAAPFKFAVVSDTQGTEFGGRSNLLNNLMTSINTHGVDYVVFPGDLAGDVGLSSWQAWESRTSVLGTNSLGRDKRLMNPGNHDRGPGGTYANWQSTFNWLPDSQAINGQQGIDQVDYYVDHGNVRFVSISTDAPGDIYNGRHVNNAPPALAWMQEVMKDVDTRNSDSDNTNDIEHVFTFSHRPVTTQLESPTGGTNGEWWESMTGQAGSDSGSHVATAFFPGHWHMYQPSRPDPDVDTAEIINGTGGGGLEGQPHRNFHGYSIVTVDGGNVDSEFFGDSNGSSGGWNFQSMDTFLIAQAGGLPTGELARYQFENGAVDQDSSISALSKGHTLSFNSGAGASNDAERGRVLDLSSGGFVDAKNIGDNNLAVLGDLTISLFAKVDSLSGGDNTLVAFGGADGSFNGSLNSQESANTAYRLSITSSGALQLAWQHDDATWETMSSTETVDDPTQWREYSVQRDGENRGVAFFVDGVQLGDVFSADFLPTGGGSGSLYIGSGAGGSNSFDGWIDDVRIDSSPVSLVPFIVADFDFDGDIDRNDWAIFAAGLGQSTPGPTDLTGDGVTNYLDFLDFKSRFQEFNGPGSFEALRRGVPEPSAVILLTLCCLVLGARTRWAKT